ncbi:hypothetical protein GQ600_1149 [Phytophthora cactorum]|nr:hypothetical protein GQ600_1149 [Phytophthora cactorum]
MDRNVLRLMSLKFATSRALQTSFSLKAPTEYIFDTSEPFLTDGAVDAPNDNGSASTTNEITTTVIVSVIHTSVLGAIRHFDVNLRHFSGKAHVLRQPTFTLRRLCSRSCRHDFHCGGLMLPRNTKQPSLLAALLTRKPTKLV